jgi:hypothetical protein
MRIFEISTTSSPGGTGGVRSARSSFGNPSTIIARRNFDAEGAAGMVMKQTLGLFGV